MASLLNMSGGSLLKKELPYDAEIEYLESTGTQYIDTGIIPTSNTGIKVVFLPIGKNDSYLCGQRNDSDNTRWTIGCNLSRGYIYCGYGYVNTTYRPTYHKGIVTAYLNYMNDGKWRTSLGAGEATIGTLSFSPRYNIRLFSYEGYNSSTPGGQWAGKIYEVEITHGGTIVMSLIPVRIGTTGYMYDKVTKQLFGNSGTGDFILGPDKTN